MLAERAKRLAELQAMTNINEESMHDVVDEATLHLVEHFAPAKGEEFKKDYCFVMGKVFLGTEKKDPTQDVNACSTFLTGDMHEWSHDLAELMCHDEHLMHYVFHAIEIYTQLRLRRRFR